MNDDDELGPKAKLDEHHISHLAKSDQSMPLSDQKTVSRKNDRC